MDVRKCVMGSLCLACISLLGFVSEARATFYYVAPSGSGGACTSPSPCSLNTGLDNAEPGDDVVLKNGVYSQRLVTVRSGTVPNPITIRAENSREAIINETGDPVGINTGTIRVKHDNIIIKGLYLEGNQQTGSAALIISRNTLGGQAVLTNVTIDDCVIHDSLGAHMIIKGLNGGILKNNLFDSSGFIVSDSGSAIYMSDGQASETWAAVSNLEIVGNTIRNSTNNAFDLKEIASNVNIHHNIIEDHAMRSAHGVTCGSGCGADDGIIRSNGNNGSSGNKFEDNIVRDSESQYIMRFSGNRVDVKNNVFYNITANSYLSTTSSPGAPMEIQDNTFCNTPNSLGSGVVTEDVILSNNRFNQLQSECDIQVERILSEISIPLACD